ncbi:MAG: elongation factor 4 [Candidatus Levybacteria bacterium RIFCSPLOWO2_01_FULL_39_24]|nr:MAG: elongation factor 4 [Candidatus Levybacteria bacterium RIFCSPHIGHO2_01_FULL_40_16]OGH46736.1 MAG: elongation factor 4 [Candidatus Levybacteria bacterium RIFCSPLOWO2_01_FULL_39_24]
MIQGNIRNFAIIAHVDHGKSTLADRLLEITNTIQKDKMQEQFLDQNPISRRRGITIKLAPVRMKYILNSEFYILNLIDTPGHVDFSYEVSRTLAACEGAILLVDATQGIQAQTVAHFREAKKQNLVLIPVVNKVDLPSAQAEITSKELIETFGFKQEEIICISAKTGRNVDKLLEAVVKKLPAPKGGKEKTLRGLIFDAVYDEFRGVVAYVRIVDGQVSKGEKIKFYQNNLESEITDLGYFSPHLVSASSLATGEIGYIITGIKDIRKVRVGDTITINNLQLTSNNFQALPGYKIPKPMVFFGVYPKATSDYIYLKESLAKLTLNDTALTYTEEYSSYLGSGFRIGFLGLLHAQIVKERIKQEFNLEILLTMPQVLYDKKEDGTIFEPYMTLIVYSPKNYVGPIMNICQSRKGSLLDLSYHESYAVLSYDMPYSMFIRGISSDLKSASEGFASLDYEVTSYKEADLAKVEIKVNDIGIDVLSELAYKDEAISEAKKKAARLKDSLSRQQFRQIIQGVVDGEIVAREEIPPFRKDVLAKMSGGDRRRKDKLLEAQKKGKSRMISQAKISIPQEALLSMIEEGN